MKIETGVIYTNKQRFSFKINRIENNKIYFQTVKSSFGDVVWNKEDYVTPKIMEKFLEGTVVVTEDLLVKSQDYRTSIANEAKSKMNTLFEESK